MAEQADRQAQDIMQIWREWLTQSERQWNAFFNEAMKSDAFARTVGGYMEMTAAFQRLMADAMQRYLTFMNMPSRSDITALGETLRTMEERLARIEELLRIATEVGRPEVRFAPPRFEPARTRRPAGAPVGGENGEQVQAVPEPFRLRR